MNTDQNASRMQLAPSQWAADRAVDGKRAILRLPQLGNKRSRSPEEVFTDNEVDVIGVGESSQQVTDRGPFLKRAYIAEGAPCYAGERPAAKTGRTMAYWTDERRMALIDEVAQRRNLWDVTSLVVSPSQAHGWRDMACIAGSLQQQGFGWPASEKLRRSRL